MLQDAARKDFLAQWFALHQFYYGDDLPGDWDVFHSRIAAIHVAHDTLMNVIAAGVGKALHAAFSKE